MSLTRTKISEFLKTDENAQSKISEAILSNQKGQLTRILDNFTVTDNKTNFVDQYKKSVSEDEFVSLTYDYIRKILAQLLDEHGVLRDEILKIFQDAANGEIQKQKLAQPAVTLANVKEKLYGSTVTKKDINEIADNIVSAALIAMSSTLADGLLGCGPTIFQNYNYLVCGSFDPTKKLNQITFKILSNDLTYELVMDREKTFAAQMEKFDKVMRLLVIPREDSVIDDYIKQIVHDLTNVKQNTNVAMKESKEKTNYDILFAHQKRLAAILQNDLDIYTREIARSHPKDEKKKINEASYLTHTLISHFAKSHYREKLLLQTMKIRFQLLQEVYAETDRHHPVKDFPKFVQSMNEHIKKMKAALFDKKHFSVLNESAKQFYKLHLLHGVSLLTSNSETMEERFNLICEFVQASEKLENEFEKDFAHPTNCLEYAVNTLEKNLQHLLNDLMQLTKLAPAIAKI